MIRNTLTLAAALSLAGGIALAQDAQMAPMDHGGNAAPAAAAATAPAAAADAPLSNAPFTAANDKMHRDMMIEFTGDADVDFVRSMIPHHQGAIDMARVALEHGDDPEIRSMAEAIIKAQEAEIAEMRAWLEKHGQ